MLAALTGFEIAAGSVTGGLAATLVDSWRGSSPIVALDRALRTALLRPPCLISFSGGKDSSLLLALAIQVASRERLPPPIPVTWRFQHAPRADESRWQDGIVRALGVPDWQILTAGHELDIVGPVAQRQLRAYGLRYPANLHLHLPIIEAAAGGSVVTGLGGDQVLSSWYDPSVSRMRRLRRHIPVGVRAAGRSWQARTEFPWLLPAPARLAHYLERLDTLARQPDPAQRLAWRLGRRHLALARASCADLGATHDVEIHHPLLDPAFHAALTASIPADAHLTRSDLIARIAGDRVPPIAYQRTTKAWFREVFVGEPTREFLASWDGAGADVSLVDALLLHDLLSRWPIPGGTQLLIQQLWLNQDRTRRRVTTRRSCAVAARY